MAELRLEIHPDAAAEAAAARRWYAARSRAAANAFVADLDTAVRLIVDGPEHWPRYLHGTRRYLLRRFPFSIVYRRTNDVIQIVAITHAKRRPGYWKTRRG